MIVVLMVVVTVTVFVVTVGSSASGAVWPSGWWARVVIWLW